MPRPNAYAAHSSQPLFFWFCFALFLGGRFSLVLFLTIYRHRSPAPTSYPQPSYLIPASKLQLCPGTVPRLAYGLNSEYFYSPHRPENGRASYLRNYNFENPSAREAKDASRRDLYLDEHLCALGQKFPIDRCTSIRIA